MTKVALVLSGGGALGAYEAGVYKALKKMHIKLDIVTGTSVGALNGIMVVQNDLKKCLNVWENISFANIYKEKIDDNIALSKLYQKHVHALVKEGGMDPKMLEYLVKSVYNENKFYKSAIDYGLVTFNLSSLKPEMLSKNKIPAKKLVDYAVASATCFPAFKIKMIDNKKYIDGGYYDNLPIDLALKLGADKIIAVDLQAFGLKKKIKNIKDITIIKPNNKLMNMLEFNATKSKRAIALGYNDTLKKYQKLDGNKYTFKKKHLQKNYKKYYNKFIENLDEVIKEKYRGILFNKIMSNQSFKEFNKIIEDCGNAFMIPEEKIYNIRSYNKILINTLDDINSIDITLVINDPRKLKNIFDKKMVIKSIYELIKTKNKRKIYAVANIFNKEFLIALYLKTIN